jgi:hypothetical protein
MLVNLPELPHDAPCLFARLSAVSRKSCSINGLPYAGSPLLTD